MESKFWTRISIVVHPNLKEKDEWGGFKVNHYHYHVIKEYRYPSWIVKKHDRFFQYIQALVQCRFPKNYVSFHYCGYIPETREKLQSKRRSKISSAQAQVTKVKNAIELLKTECAGTLFADYTKHPLYPKLKDKLLEKEFKLQQAVMEPVEEVI